MPRKSKKISGKGKTPQNTLDSISKYRKSKGGAQNIQKTIGATYSRQEGDRIAAAIKGAGITPAQILRAVAAWIESGAHPATVAAIPEDAAEYERQNAAIRQAEREAHAAQTTAAPAPQPADSHDE